MNRYLWNGIQHARQQTLHRHCVAANTATLEEVAIAVPLLIFEAEVMLAVFAVKDRFKVLELNTIFFVDVAVGFFNIADDVLTRRVMQGVTFQHGAEEFFHRHDVWANML